MERKEETSANRRGALLYHGRHASSERLLLYRPSGGCRPAGTPAGGRFLLCADHPTDGQIQPDGTNRRRAASRRRLRGDAGSDGIGTQSLGRTVVWRAPTAVGRAVGSGRSDGGLLAESSVAWPPSALDGGAGSDRADRSEEH